ncbi:MAG TPA: hypothetical protein VFU81_21240, partial [Thermomicrobiales bacterium]|nr:hypothetical protein [Thermomicrobiales bacterium]
MPSIDQLLAIRSAAGSEMPRWLPDGKSIVVASSLGGAPELWAVPADGGAPRRLTVGMGGVGHLAATLFQPSPDGRWIAYVSTKSGAYEVWLWSADGMPDRQLTRLGASIEAMSWAPDSRSLVLAG